MGGGMKEAGALLSKLPALLERWKYPLLIFLAGLALMLWPGGSSEEKPVQKIPEIQVESLPADDGSDDAYLAKIIETFGSEPVDVVDEIRK